MTNASLDMPVASILGGRTASAFQKAFKISTIRQLLNHAPRRYLKRGELTELDKLPENENVTVVAKIVSVQERRMQARKGSILEVVITDSVGQAKLTWFNQAWRAQQLKPGMFGIFAGKTSKYRGETQLTHPDYHPYDEEMSSLQESDKDEAEAWAQKPVPIYAATSKLRSWVIAKSIAMVLDAVVGAADPLPETVLKAARTGGVPLMSEIEAYESVHRPKTESEYKRATDNLKFREAFELQLGLFHTKLQFQSTKTIPRLTVIDGPLARFDATLPYKLTGDQSNVGETISAELASVKLMHRLLQGEVGSGKTLVALRAMLQVADTDGQAALLAPTEVLASQHLRSITELLGPELTEELHPTLLTGSLKTSARKSAELAIASGKAKIVIGTHALMSESTNFADLGLIVIDEQHRFGVDQREALRRKGVLPPHVLVMTATPIPRTVALTAFGDLEFSTLREMPAGRAEIVSHVVPLAESPGWFDRVWARAAEEIADGRQVYVVCPAISPSETEGVPDEDEIVDDDDQADTKTYANVAETLELIRQHPLLGKISSAALTGAMAGEDKDHVMREFADGNIDLLVATTVIEVGVNVPNASAMIVLNSDRFGVSQLHQLRGRVGRGEHAGLCLFVTDAEKDTPARVRIEEVASTLDGFVLAQVDLRMRREGDVLGANQSGGVTSLQWVRVLDDLPIIEVSGEIAKKTLEADPHLKTMPALKERIRNRENVEQISHLNRS